MKLTLSFLALLALLPAAPLSAMSANVTVRSGETWLFAIDRGHLVKARQVHASAKPGRSEILVAVRAMMGTTMTITNNSPISYTYRATLLGARKATPARACTLPANNRPVFEHWPQPASAVRLSNFKPAPNGGTCP